MGEPFSSLLQSFTKGDTLTAVSVIVTILSSTAAVLAKYADNRLRRLGQRIDKQRTDLKLYMSQIDGGSVDAYEHAPLRLQVSAAPQTWDSTTVPGVQTSSQIAKERVQLRIFEAIALRSNRLKSAKHFRFAANGLTWTNFILGGVLASSFIQVTVSAKWTGFLGVLVLVSSLIKQHYHPDLDAELASKQALQLIALIRPSEDRLAILNAKVAAGQDQADELVGLLQWITQRLGQIEGVEDDAKT